MEHIDLLRFMMYRKTHAHDFLNASIFVFVSARKIFSTGSSSYKATPEKTSQRPDTVQSMIEVKVDALASQVSDLTLIVDRVFGQSQFPISSGLPTKSARTARILVTSLQSGSETSAERPGARPVTSWDILSPVF